MPGPRPLFVTYSAYNAISLDQVPLLKYDLAQKWPGKHYCFEVASVCFRKRR